MAEKKDYENVVAEPTYLPSKYAYKGYTDTFYDEKEDSGASSFLLGAIVGGVIGAATALFLAPKTGKEMRDDFSTQASQIKEKSIELSAIAKDKATEYGAVAKDKATEYGAVAKDKASEYGAIAKDKASDITTIAKEKTEEVTKTIQQQSEQVADKVKSAKDDTEVPTIEEVAEIIDQAKEKSKAKADEAEEKVTATAEALKEAVTEKIEEKK